MTQNSNTRQLRRATLMVSTFVAAMLCAPAHGQTQKVGAKPEAKNMRLVGYNDLQARSAYQPVIHRQGDRWIAYIGHHGGTVAVPKPINPMNGQPEFNGTSIVDVTNPAKPKYLFHIPGQEGNYEQGGAQMVRVCDGKTLPGGKADANAVYLLRSFGGEAHEIWNVADPAAPKLVTRLSEGLKDTHKSWWECDTGIAYLVSGVDGWRTRRMTEVYDLSDPAKPVKIRDFGLVGQQPGATGTVPTDLHGMISLGPRPIASISATAPTRAACCRSSTARSCSTVRRSRRRKICAIRWSGSSRCCRSRERTRPSQC